MLRTADVPAGTTWIPRTRVGQDWLLTAALFPSATLVLVLVDPRLVHWFVIPVTAGGILIGVDALGWLRRRFDIFDPRALLGLLGVHFFYLAPLLHVVFDYWPPRIPPPGNWREALGAMATLNLVGLAIYRWLVSTERLDRFRSGARRTEWRAEWRIAFDERRFHRVGIAAAVVGVTAFGVEVALFGGISGFVDAMLSEQLVLTGMSWLIIPAESFPLIVFALVAVRWRGELARRPALVVLLLFALVAVQFLVGGLRGSRSSTVWPVLLALILVHLLVVAVSRRVLLCCAAAFLAFMFSYGLYKVGGADVLDFAQGSRAVEEFSTATGVDPVPSILLGDLGRADIQALVLDRKREGYGELGYGITYLGTPVLLVPRWLLPHRPPSKLNVGTDALYGPRYYNLEARRWSQRVYGLTGEAMLNFGPLGGLFAFVPLGLIVRRSRTFYLRARQDDGGLGRKLLAPSICVATVLVLTSDVDNLLFFTVQRFVPLALVVLLAVRRIRA